MIFRKKKKPDTPAPEKPVKPKKIREKKVKPVKPRKVRKVKEQVPDINPNEKINYNVNDLLDELHARFFQSYAMTMDTGDYVPQKYIDKVYKQIYKYQKKLYKKAGKTDKAYQKWFKSHLPQLLAERQEKQLQEQLKQMEGADEKEQPK